MLDPGSLDSRVEVIAHLTLIILMELSAKEGGDVVRFHGVNGGPGEMPVDGLEVLLALEHDIRCILSLHHAPVVAESELFDEGAKPLCKVIEPSVEEIDFEGITQALGLAEIRNLREDIIHESKGDGIFVQT